MEKFYSLHSESEKKKGGAGGRKREEQSHDSKNYKILFFLSSWSFLQLSY